MPATPVVHCQGRNFNTTGSSNVTLGCESGFGDGCAAFGVLMLVLAVALIVIIPKTLGRADKGRDADTTAAAASLLTNDSLSGQVSLSFTHPIDPE